MKEKIEKFCDWCIDSKKLHLVMVWIFCISVGFTVVSWVLNAVTVL